MGVACLEFRGENFRGWLKNREIRESFLPRTFPAIRYALLTLLSSGIRCSSLSLYVAIVIGMKLGNGLTWYTALEFDKN